MATRTTLRHSSCRGILAALATGGMLSGSPAGASEIGHFAGGLLNIRDYVMPPKPDLYMSVYNYYYTTKRLNDSHGRRIDSVTIGPDPGPGVTIATDVDVDVFVTSPSILWVSPWTVLGARYGALVAPSFANSSVGAALAIETGRGINPDTSTAGLGDIYVQPVWLDWSLPHWDFALGYGFYAPTGRYETETATFPTIGDQKVEDSDNIGLGYWTHQFQGAVAWYPWESRGTAAIGALTYEINGKKDDFDFTPGQRLTLNWGVSQYVPLTDDKAVMAELALVGYSHWQITDDTGSDASSDVHDQAHAIGAQLGVAIVPWNAALNVHYFHEFASVDRFQGDVIGLNLSVKW